MALARSGSVLQTPSRSMFFIINSCLLFSTNLINPLLQFPDITNTLHLNDCVPKSQRAPVFTAPGYMGVFQPGHTLVIMELTNSLIAARSATN